MLKLGNQASLGATLAPFSGVRSLNFSQRLLRVSAAVLQAISNCFAGLDAAQRAWLSAGCEPLSDFLNCFYLSFVFGEQREGEPRHPSANRRDDACKDTAAVAQLGITSAQRVPIWFEP